MFRFRPRLRRGFFVLTLIRGSLQMGHPWPQCSSIGIHADCPPNQRQDSAFTHVAFCGVHAIGLQRPTSAVASPDSQMTCV